MKAIVNGYAIEISEFEIAENYIEFVTNGKRFRTGKNNFSLEEGEDEKTTFSSAVKSVDNSREK